MKKFIFWLKCARLYSLPITVLSWVVAFIFSYKYGGNVYLGFLALIGISLVHLATNLTDDYFDYKVLTKDDTFINAAKSCKCAYLKNNQATVNDLRNTIIIFLTVAAIIGIFLFFVSGYYVAFLALIGVFIAVSYPILSQNALGEAAIIIAYGPLLFEGVYYVMCSKFSPELLPISFACALMTNTILYAHMLMDFDQDECSHKKTLCRALKTKSNALNFILVFYLAALLIMSASAIICKNPLYYLVWLILPMIIDLYNSLKLYNTDKTIVPKVHFWNLPLDNWGKIKTTPDAPFFFRFIYSRNIMIIFMLLTSIAIIFN